MVAHDDSPAPAGVNSNVASPARVYDYWLGGKNNFAVDRAAGEAFKEAFPGIVMGVRMNRVFLARAVRYLAAEAGIRQFLDIGAGLPTANNVHEVAQAAAPDSRVVYVDNDPAVLPHATALMTAGPEGACDFLQADLLEPGDIIQGAARTLDYTLPVAVSLLQILQFIPDEKDPWGLVGTIMDAMPSGSYLISSQPTTDVITGTITAATDRYNDHLVENPVKARTTDEIRRFFASRELIDPGLVQLHRWRPDPGADTSSYEIPALAGVGRKP